MQSKLLLKYILKNSGSNDRDAVTSRTSRIASQSAIEDTSKPTPPVQQDEILVKVPVEIPKDTFYQKDDHKLLMNWDYYNYKFIRTT